MASSGSAAYRAHVCVPKKLLNLTRSAHSCPPKPRSLPITPLSLQPSTECARRLPPTCHSSPVLPGWLCALGASRHSERLVAYDTKLCCSPNSVAVSSMRKQFARAAVPSSPFLLAVVQATEEELIPCQESYTSICVRNCTSILTV